MLATIFHIQLRITVGALVVLLYMSTFFPTPRRDDHANTRLVYPTNITIYIRDEVNEHDSTFRTNLLQRFGTGRLNYHVHGVMAACDNNSCNAQETVTTDHYSSASTSPCLAVSKHASPTSYCDHATLRCSYPRCKTVITGDEYCKLTMFDVRHYYSHNANDHHQIYLPLGPRYDSWEALQLIKQSPDFVNKPPSSRRFAFNAIFTLQTNLGREILANRLSKVKTHNGNNNSLPIYTAFSRRWSAIDEVKNVDANKLNPQSYMEVVLDSIFTISPAGHNAECFRLHEAVEAGSIPVLIKEDLYSSSGDCVEPLHHWQDAPIIVLNSWDEVSLMVDVLLGHGIEWLDQMQQDLREWYDGHMRKVVREFEDYLMEAT